MISYTPSEFYTGETATFNLSDVRCARTLNEFAAWNWTGEWEEAAKLAEAYGKSGVIGVLVSLAVGELLKKTTTKPFSDGATAGDSPVLHPQKKAAESIAIGEAFTRELALYVTVSLAVGDLLRMAGNKTFSDSAAFSDTAFSSVKKNISDVLTLADVLKISRTYVFKEAVIAASDGFLSKFVFNTAEGVSPTDSVNGNVRKKLLDALACGDLWKNAFTKPYADGVSFSDDETNAPKKNVSEGLTVADTFARVLKAVLAETLLTSDLLSAQPKPHWADSVASADNERGMTEKNILETLSVTDIFFRALGIIFTEKLLADDLLSAQPKPHWADGMKAADTYTKAVKAVLPDGLSITDVLADKLAFLLTDGAGVADAWHAAFKKALTDTARLADRLTRESGALFTEAVTAEDDWIGKYAIAIAEALTAKDAYNRAFKKSLTDAAKLADRLGGATTKNLQEEVTALDSFYRASIWTRLYSEAMKVTDAMAKKAAATLEDGLVIKDVLKRTAVKFLVDTALASDTLSHTASFSRDFKEAAAIGESEYKEYIAAYDETCSLLDAMIHAANGVLSDVIAAQGAMTLAEFTDTVSSPSGYSPFVDFRVGDYEYKEALYRFQIQKQEASVLPALTGLIVHVDIPDTNDRGSATLAAEETKIHYNKSYYHAPEVSVTVTGGTGDGLIIPYVLSTDGEDTQGRYFEVVLKDISGNIVAGSISWTAKGY